MHGVAIFLICKRKMLNRIKEFYSCKVKVGQVGFAKNKGSTAIKLVID